MNDLTNEDNNAGPAILIRSVVPFGFLSSISQQGIVSVGLILSSGSLHSIKSQSLGLEV